ncbi:MAG: pyrimidine dimer DNA glycosylase/endonuclease V [Brevinematales bacterium]|nr:pyrimidine dimer DNA glycosylase/endonuclease V [Brevinematales bacterium]
MPFNKGKEMRLWSISPEYLDTRGILAVWREGLLARKVLLGETKGYKFHPQLERFKNYIDPIEAIDSFLTYVYLESKKRGYNFDVTKINFSKKEKLIKITSGQIYFEFDHLLNKLKERDYERYNLIKNLKDIEPNPVFDVYLSEAIERWERI